MALPKFAVFKSNYNNKYLSYVNEDVAAHGYARCTGEDILSPTAKFAIEMAKSGNDLVHIRCCYNNQYLVRGDSKLYIKAGAAQSEEDKSKSSCTLFEPVYLDDAKKTARFRHVQLGHYACLWRSGNDFESCLCAASSSPNSELCDVFTVIDWESLLVLPQHVAFKGSNGKYLSSRLIDGIPYLQFASDDSGDPTVGNEVFTTPDGSIRIKSNHFGKFWRLNPDDSGEPLLEYTSNWILADSDDTSNNNSETLFWPIKLNNNAIALRNLGNNNFCRIGDDTHGHFEVNGSIKANVPTISAEARLGVEELVLTRNIFNVNYRLDDARIYNETTIVMGNGVAINRSSQRAETIELSFKITESTSTFWNASVSVTVGVSTTFETGVPLIAEGKITISADISGGYQWGETEESTKESECKYTVIVPPMTIANVSYLATQGTCDIPFSYSQRDTLTNGDEITNPKNDGLYTGMNCYDMHFQHTEQKL